MTSHLRRLGTVALIAATSIVNAPTTGNATAAPMIVNGDLASIASRPYQIALLDIRFGSDSYHRFRCGGSVVAPKIIITAGHCTFDSLDSAIPTSPANLRVLANTASLLGGGQIVKVSGIDRHPDYHPEIDPTVNDIAVLHLTSAVSAPPVAVISTHSDFRAQPANTTATTSGWGCYQATSDCRNLNNYPTDLHKADVTLRASSQCAQIFNAFGVDFNPTASLCAGEFDLTVNAPGPCFGDSGGPLTIDGLKGADLLVGVVSWGIKCGATPVAYARITTYRKWLISVGVPVTPAPFRSITGPTIHESSVPVAGDFDGDSNGDLMAYIGDSTPDQIYRGGAGPQLSPGSAAAIGTAYRTIACDTNEDNATDLILYRPGPNSDKALFGAAEPGSFTLAPGINLNGSYLPVAGDFNGDAFCDIMLYGPGSAPDRLLEGDGTGSFTLIPVQAINNIYVPVVGDWNADEIDDILWYSKTGTSRRWDGSVGGFISHPTASRPGPYKPIAGDFDANGYWDLLLYNPGTGADVLWTSDSSGFHQTRDITINGIYEPATTDIDGDGATEVIWVGAEGATNIWSWAL